MSSGMMTRRSINNGTDFVRDHDTYFVVTRLLPNGKKLKMRVKSSGDHRAAMKKRDVGWFSAMLDDAIAREEKQKATQVKAAKELEKVREAVRAGIPIEQKSLPSATPGAAPRHVVWVMPWWKRLGRWLWYWIKRPFSFTAVVVEVPKSMSMKPPLAVLGMCKRCGKHPIDPTAVLGKEPAVLCRPCFTDMMNLDKPWEPILKNDKESHDRTNHYYTNF